MEEQKKNPAQGLSESEQVQVRRQKLADLQAAGHDPFTLTKYPQDAYSADLKEEFKDLPNETDSGKQVALAGRMMSKRVMGKASFAHLRDDKGDIQLYVRRDELGDEPYAAFKKLDVGDIIGVKGEVFRTKTGELSVRATELVLLAKSLRPLPEKFHGLTDTEMRYRQRYVDLIANPEVKDTFVKRSQILKEIRAYLDEKGFLDLPLDFAEFVFHLVDLVVDRILDFLAQFRTGLGREEHCEGRTDDHAAHERYDGNSCVFHSC